jgi:protein-S-isoprenylcysteine O-methyltransferase Ste14
MLKSLVRGAGFLAYFLVTLEMIFMVTPFALYYYSAYAPFLSAAASIPALAWLPAFFLPHLSIDIVPSVGGLILLVGVAGFLVGACQIYYAKFRKRGVVKGGLYQRIRHPQYLFLGVAGLGLLIVWPRFILLLVFINMLWFYYLLARSEERRIGDRYGEIYGEQMQRTSMFLPGEPGGHLVRWLFGWIRGHRTRLLVVYALSLVGVTSAAFVLRALTFRMTTHLSLSGQRVAAVSLLSVTEGELRRLVESAKRAEEIQGRIKQLDDWVLVQALEGKSRAVHVVIDAGMTPISAKNLPLSEKGIKLVLSRRLDRSTQEDPFSTRARWQPVLVAEINGQKTWRVIELNQSAFLGNPVMPVF